MTDWKDRLEQEVENLKTARDELRVQLHLAKQEATEAWEHAEKRWTEVEAKLKQVGRLSEEPLQEIGDAARKLLHEIREGYERVRKGIER
jgi:hypothetical protein